MFLKPCTLLAIESSCDETSASVLKDGKILSNIIATQIIHEQYGGVVPELASREHQKNIVPVVDAALKAAGINLDSLDAIGFTRGPGLLGALLVGSSFAKSMAWAKKIPLIEVQHIQAHVLAHFIGEEKPNFPFLCLTVSGGHTQIVLVKDYLVMEILGETQDDAVGEAFDKTAKIMGLPYPGGALIDKYAKEGNALAFAFPAVEMPALHFSFSGIKTAFLNFLNNNQAKNQNFIQENIHDICASVQYTLLQILIKKLKKAAKQTNIKQIAIAGGVSANSGLRSLLREEGEKNNWKVFIPALEYCTDNAAMIAITAYFKYQKEMFVSQNTSPLPRMEWE